MDISVIVAIYNVEKYLDNCLRSLMNQNYSNAEFILVDDGSTDTSSLICDNAQKIDPRIRVIHKTNGGLSDARNAGLAIAKGKYIMFLDGDDLIDNGSLMILYNLAQQTDSDFIQYSYRETPKADISARAEFNGRYEYVAEQREMFMRLNLLGGIGASACTKFIKKKSIQNLRFKKGKLHEDEFFTTELLTSVTSATYITDFSPYQYIVREGSIINQHFNPKRVYDLCEMYDLRISKLEKMGLDDLAKTFQTKFYTNLYLQYLKARFSRNECCSRYIRNRLEKFRTVKRNGLPIEVQIMSICPRIILPLLYGLRSVLNCKI